MVVNNKHMAVCNNRGIATIETVTLLFIFVLFMSFAVGFFGVVHTGIVNSISARAYIFESFRNRTNLAYRSDEVIAEPSDFYGNIGFRINGISTEGENPGSDWKATLRKISSVYEAADEVRVDSSQAPQVTGRESRRFNPVWIKTTYGICLNAKCGG